MDLWKASIGKIPKKVLTNLFMLQFSKLIKCYNDTYKLQNKHLKSEYLQNIKISVWQVNSIESKAL